MYVQFVLRDERFSARIATERAIVVVQLHMLLETEVSVEFFATETTLELWLFMHHNVFVQF